MNAEKFGNPELDPKAEQILNSPEKYLAALYREQGDVVARAREAGKEAVALRAVSVLSANNTPEVLAKIKSSSEQGDE